ncbi:MAG: DUF2807 domain-containing protein [Chitinophagaceae bacterium]|nr:DUF2807 domain-containing protein [Chitinophagaceae bacterium]
MRSVISISLAVLFLAGCENGFKRIEGNGVMQTVNKSLSDYENVDISGSFKVKVIPSSESKVEFTVDENLVKYVMIDQDGDRLRIRTKNNVNLKPSRSIEVTLYGDDMEKFELAGSSTLRSEGMLENENKIEVVIAGSGDAKLDIKTPVTKVKIGGSGKVEMNGKTRDAKIDIAGSGDFLGETLLSENVEISIAGSGNARVFASMDLQINIAGSGDVFYTGKPANVKKNIAGSGRIKTDDNP